MRYYHRTIIIAMPKHPEISEAIIGDIIRFNTNEITLNATMREWETDEFLIKLTHPEFPKVPAGELLPRYYLPEAKKRFPFLFVDTNPILYRKYQGEERK